MAISDRAHFNNYDPASFGWPHRVPDLVPLEFNGVNFGTCAKDAHGLFTRLLTELVPHIEGGLKPGFCWCYSTTDDLPDGSWSFHRYGIAIDVNWNVNKMGNDIPDATGKYAMPRAKATELAHKYGCEWGGNWLGGFHDNMHIEIHLSPDDARTITADLSPTDPDWSDMATQAEIQKMIDASIDKRLRAAVFGGNADLHKSAPDLYPDENEGLTDRLRKLEKKSASPH